MPPDFALGCFPRYNVSKISRGNSHGSSQKDGAYDARLASSSPKSPPLFGTRSGRTLRGRSIQVDTRTPSPIIPAISNIFLIWICRLNETCLQAENGCDCIAIPHNSNWSNGHKFTGMDYGENLSLEEQRKAAAIRAQMEPLVEFHQHKGSMECKNGFEGIPTIHNAISSRSARRTSLIAGIHPERVGSPVSGAFLSMTSMDRSRFRSGCPRFLLRPGHRESKLQLEAVRLQLIP